MSKYSLSVLEDCSPFYVRFTFENLTEIIDYVKAHQADISSSTVYDSVDHANYSHINLTLEVGQHIINMLPFKDITEWHESRVAIFDTPPGGGCGIHKDGKNTQISFNIVLESLDNLCETTWYETTEEFRLKEKKGFPNIYSRNVFANYRIMNELYQPVKRLIAKENEMILFNTDIFHAWQNIHSLNGRKVLTLRSLDKTLSFEDMKKMLEL